MINEKKFPPHATVYEICESFWLVGCGDQVFSGSPVALAQRLGETMLDLMKAEHEVNVLKKKLEQSENMNRLDEYINRGWM